LQEFQKGKIVTFPTTLPIQPEISYKKATNLLHKSLFHQLLAYINLILSKYRNMSFVICYCNLAFPIVQTTHLPDIITHMSGCPARRNESPVFDFVQRLEVGAVDQERRVLLEELKLELRDLERLIHPIRPSVPLSIPPRSPLAPGPSGYQSAPLPICPVCELFLEECLQLKMCSHRLCTKHIRKDFENKYLRELGRVRCPVPGCNKPIGEQDMRRVMGRDLVEELKNRVRRQFHP